MHQTERELRIGHGRFDPVGGELSLDGRTVRLRPRTAAFLAHLATHAGRVIGKDELMQAIWPDTIVTEDSLVQCVKEIRRALGRSGRDWIRTVPRQGYALVADTAGAPARDPRADESARARRRRWQAAAFVVTLALGALAAHLLPSDRAGAPSAQGLSIVVLPVANLTRDPGREDEADELTERIATALARMSGVMVIAPGTAFTLKGKPIDVRRLGPELGVRYALEGSLRRQDTGLLLTLRLVSAADAAQLWSDEFAADADQVSMLREDVVARVASTLGLRLISAEGRRLRHEAPGNPDAAQLLAMARAALRWSGQGTDGVTRARQLLEEAVLREGSSGEAWALLSWTYLDEVRFRGTGERDIPRAAQAAQRALALAPESAEAHGAQARVLYNQGRIAPALVEFEKAIELNPNDPLWHAHSGAALIMLGRPGAALAAIDQARRLSPRDPQLPQWEMYRGVANLHIGRDDDAIEHLLRSVGGNPSSAFSHLFLASALGNARRIDEARAHVAQLQALHPGFTLTQFRAREPSDAEPFRLQRQRVYEGLRLAGMPE